MEKAGDNPPKKDKTKQKVEKMDKKDKKKSSKKSKRNFWALKILVLTICLSLCFSILSETMLTGTGIAIAIVILIPFLAAAIVSDMIGVAAASATIEPFRAMAARKVKGAKEAIKLIENNEKVSSICNDVIGDVCGIICGAVGVSITAKIIVSVSGDFVKILIASLVSALIAGLTVYGKALGKKYAINQSTKIMGLAGKLCAFFNMSWLKKKKKNSKMKIEEKSKPQKLAHKDDDDGLEKGKKQTEEKQAVEIKK